MLIYIVGSKTILIIISIVWGMLGIVVVFTSDNVSKKMKKVCEEFDGTNDYQVCLDAVKQLVVFLQQPWKLLSVFSQLTSF